MTTSFKVLIFSAGFLCAAALTGQSGPKTPTAEEARTTCLTLERLLDIAAREEKAADAAALSRAYKFSLKYVSDSSSLKDATAYVQEFDGKNPSLLATYTYKPAKGGGFTNRTVDDVAELSGDDEHKSAVIIVDKQHDFQVMHSNLDANALGKIMLEHGGAAGVSAGKGH